MEISDELIRSRTESPVEAEARKVFQDTLGLIHIALVAHYSLHDSEAVELEKDLYLWFHRFCLRPGSRSPRECRPFLLVACCQFAREYQRYVVGSGVRESDDKLRVILERDPADVARDFSRSLATVLFPCTRRLKRPKILQFRSAPRRRVLSSSRLRELQRLFGRLNRRSPCHLLTSCLGDADVILAILTELRSRVDGLPGVAAAEADGTLRFAAWRQRRWGCLTNGTTF